MPLQFSISFIIQHWGVIVDISVAWAWNVGHCNTCICKLCYWLWSQQVCFLHVFEQMYWYFISKQIWEQHTGLFNLSVVYFFTDDYEETRFKCSFCGKMLRIDALVGRWSSNGKLNSLLFNFAYQLIIMLLRIFEIRSLSDRYLLWLHSFMTIIYHIYINTYSIFIVHVPSLSMSENTRACLSSASQEGSEHWQWRWVFWP